MQTDISTKLKLMTGMFVVLVIYYFYKYGFTFNTPAQRIFLAVIIGMLAGIVYAYRQTQEKKTDVA